MSLFRKNTIFHTEEALPDPEEIKLRFRRRVLLLSLAAFLLVLGFPVLKELSTSIMLRNDVRVFAQNLLTTRLLALQSRQPISLQLEPDSHTWLRIFHKKGLGCTSEIPSPYEKWTNENISWHLKLKKENGEKITGKTLCQDPLQGLLLDSTPIANGELLLTAKSPQNSETAIHLIISNYGAEIQTIAHPINNQ